MEDKILQIKKEMKRVIKVKGLTRYEKYNLAKEKSHSLSKKEKEILIKECHRDFESYDRMKDMTELITIFLTGIGLIVTLYEALAEKSLFLVDTAISMITLIGIYIIGAVVMVWWLQRYRSENMHVIKYMLDVLEEVE